MPVRVAINGFGRTGRAMFRAAREQDAEIEWAGINDVVTVVELGSASSARGGWRSALRRCAPPGAGTGCTAANAGARESAELGARFLAPHLEPASPLQAPTSSTSPWSSA